MEFLGSLGEHWSELLETATFLLAAFSFRDNAKATREEAAERKVQNLFALTAAHRDIWNQAYEKPELWRTISDNVDVKKEPPTPQEEIFVTTLIHQLATWFEAENVGSYLNKEAVSADIKQFFSNPIPLTVWEKAERFQNRAFVAFVRECLDRKSTTLDNTGSSGS